MKKLIPTEQPLYRADILRIEKTRLNFKSDDIVEKSKELKIPLAPGTVSGLLTGKQKNPALRSLWVMSQILEIPLKSLFEFEEQPLSNNQN